MFNGLITHQGLIQRIVFLEPQMRLYIQVEDADFWADVAIGDSIAIMGCCLTVISLENNTACFDVSSETLRCTQLGSLKEGEWVHVEKALRFGDRLQGHLLLGHVADVGKVITRETEGDCLVLQIQIPSENMKYIAVKGSIAINGVSLTINRWQGDTFWVNLIPHTLEKTQLGRLNIGSLVNIEVDPLARYIERLISGAEHVV